MARGIPGKHQWMGRWPAQQASRLGRYDVTKNDITRVTTNGDPGQTGSFLQYQAKEGYEMVD